MKKKNRNAKKNIENENIEESGYSWVFTLFRGVLPLGVLSAVFTVGVSFGTSDTTVENILKQQAELIQEAKEDRKQADKDRAIVQQVVLNLAKATVQQIESDKRFEGLIGNSNTLLGDIKIGINDLEKKVESNTLIIGLMKEKVLSQTDNTRTDLQLAMR